MTTAARIDELRKKFDENPRRYFAPLANELRKAGELSQAIALCREHLPKQPGHMSGYIVFGQALFESGELGEAQSVFEQALALDPENLIALRHLGDIARRQGDPVVARRWYERVLDADPRNDDIAAQLATLATPAASMSAVAPVAPTPTYGVPPIMVHAALPTPDAAMRAVEMPVFAPPAPAEPPLLDLDAIEAVGDNSSAPVAGYDEPATVSERESAVDEPLETEMPAATALDIEPPTAVFQTVDTELLIGDAEIDAESPALALEDPLDFAAPGTPAALEEVVDVEAAFEEGLAAPEWPDTSALVARLGTPRSATPISVEIPADAVDAFGREPHELVASSPAETPDVQAELIPDAIADQLPAVELTVADVDTAPDVVASEFDAPVAGDEQSEVVSAAEELGQIVSTVTDDDLPWLAAPSDDATPIAATPVAEVAAIAEALEDDAHASGEFDEVTVLEESDGAAVPIEASFADLMPTIDEEESVAAGGYEAEATAPDASPAFVTETMGELLVAQGLTEQAVSIYEELVRRRPYDPVLSARLAELRDQLAPANAPPSEPAVPVFTARERFARLAARRVRRRTPAVPGPVIEAAGDDSLSSLFGSEPSPLDETAAASLAAAFAPVPEVDEPAPASSLFAPTPAAGVARLRTPLRPITPFRAATPMASPAVPSASDFSFDRFFPDPAVGSGQGPSASAPGENDAAPASGTPSAGDDLAQFSAWLKGLGNT